MNEVALNHVFPSTTLGERVFGTKASRQSSAFYGYSLTTIAIGIGWLFRDHSSISPTGGLGYWLGIAGGSMMLVLLLYPLRKRIRAFRFLGRNEQWFRAHMILGVLGPLLVLYHSNFQIGSFNSKVALYCMLLVAGSGVIGRHIYARIHNGLYGSKTSLRDLQETLSDSLEQSHGIAKLMPQLAQRLEALNAEVQGDSITGNLSIGSSLIWTLRRYTTHLSLLRTVRIELRDRAESSSAVARDQQKLRRASSAYIRNFMGLVGSVAQFTLYERLFSLWHVLHLPLFFMMVISALVHVLAVHMY